MKVVIQDANALIDLEMAGLIEQWFALGFETWTTDLILAQIIPDRQPIVYQLVDRGILHIRKTPGRVMEQLYALKMEVDRGLEIEDVSALFWASRSAAVLLTGDRLLTKEARRRGVVVHGTLWVMDMLVARQLVLPPIAATALRMLMQQQRRLPADECQVRLLHWNA